MNRRDLRRLAEARIEDARVLLASRRYAAAYYLGGYAVECAIKVCIARQIRAREYPPDRQFSNDLFSHNLQTLIRRADPEDALESAKSAERAFELNWAIVRRWSENARYESRGRQDAQVLFDAITDPVHGALQWLRQHW